MSQMTHAHNQICLFVLFAEKYVSREGLGREEGGVGGGDLDARFDCELTRTKK